MTRMAGSECVVCIEAVQDVDAVWQCDRCFALFHFACIRAWASNALRPASRLLAGLFAVPNIWHDALQLLCCCCGLLRPPLLRLLLYCCCNAAAASTLLLLLLLVVVVLLLL
jgi:hypothetical protein